MAVLRTLADYRGLSAATGGAVAGDDHLRQSIRDILTTLIGTRLMRRTYGSRNPALIDAPMNADVIADLVQSTALAIHLWEPRVVLKRVVVRTAAPGHPTLDLVLETNGRQLRLEGVI